MGGLRKPVYGVGINDADYFTQRDYQPDGRKGKWVCPFYQRWRNMLKRALSEADKIERPTNIGNSVCEEWKTFSNFKAWMETQPWDQGDLHLDKDILVLGNKEYSPTTCAFVPLPINSLFLRRQRFRGEYPIGVSKRVRSFNYKKPFYAKLDGTIGYFSTVEEAHKAWQLAKADHIESVLEVYVTDTSFQQKVYNAVKSRATMLRQQAEEGIETTIL